jgi:hypothetical protein
MRSALYSNSFEELEYRVYFVCCFVMFFFYIYRTKVIYVYVVHVMELYIIFLIDGTEKQEDVFIWLEQYC